MEDTPPGIASRRCPALRRAIEETGTEVLTSREWTLGDRIRELYFISKPHAPGDGSDPDEAIYETLARHAQDVAAGRELYAGMSAGCEIRAEHLERTLRNVRAALDGHE